MAQEAVDGQGSTPPKQTLKALQVRVEPDYAEHVATLAMVEGISEARLIRKALDLYLSQEGQDIPSLKARVRKKHEDAMRLELAHLDKLAAVRTESGDDSDGDQQSRDTDTG